MLKIYKNEIFSALERSGFNASEFALKDGVDTRVATNNDIRFFKATVITHSESNLHYRIIEAQAPHVFFVFCSRFGVKDPSHFRYPNKSELVRITDVCLGLLTWIQSEIVLFKQEQSAPDLWAQAAMSEPLISEGEKASDLEAFTPEQKQQIRLSIQDFRALLIQEFNPPKEVLGRIDARLSYLEKGLDRLNRFDWKSIALSSLIGIATNLSLDTERGKLLWQLFNKAFASVMRVLGNGLTLPS